MEEELEMLDQKAIEQSYIDSYHYSSGQKLVAAIAVIVVVLGIIGAGVYLFMSLISLL